MVSEYLRQIAIGGVLAVVIGSALVYGVANYFPLSATTSATQVQNSADLCVQQLPQNTAAYAIFTKSFYGYFISFPNGTSTTPVPIYTCPVPVPHNVYNLVVAIETSPSFIRAENGSRYLVDPAGIAGGPAYYTGPNGSTKAWISFNFDDWSNATVVISTICDLFYYNISRITASISYNVTTSTYMLSNISVSSATSYSVNDCPAGAATYG